MIKTKGTELYMKVDGLFEKIACVSAFSGLSETMALRGRSTLCKETATSEPSFPEFGGVEFTTRLSYDAERLLTYQRERKTVDLYLGFGDSTTQPTMPASTVLLPQARSFVHVNGYFTGFSLSVDPNSIVHAGISFYVLEQIDVLTQKLIPLVGDFPWSNGQFWR